MMTFGIVYYSLAFKQYLFFTGELNKSNSTTVRISNNQDVDVPNDSLESNITIVTTTHPPVLHQSVDDNDSLVNHGRFSSSQVVIVANENNKTRVS